MNQPNQDLELDIELEQIPDPGEHIDWRTRLARHLEISNILRLAGGGLTVAAIIIFLFQRWENATDLYRYGMIFGETLILAGLGFATSHWLKDQRSARIFLSLSLVSTSAVFTILASMIDSYVQWMPVAANLPDFTIWAIDSLDSVLLVLVVSLIVLGGQSLFTLTVLARPAARSLCLLLLANISLLLLPVRDMSVTTLVVLPALFLGFRYLAILRHSTAAMRTGEANLASVLVMLPLFIMIGRGAAFYAQGPVAIGSLALLAYLLLRQIAQSLRHAIRLRSALELISLLPAALFSLQLVTWIDHNSYAMINWLIALFGAVMGGFLMDLATRACAGRERYLQAAFYTGLLVAITEQALYPSTATALFGVAVTTLALLFSYSTKMSWPFKYSLLTLLGSLVHLVAKIVFTLDAGTWISMSILGMTAIILAAVVERYGKQLMEVMYRFR